jgi:hypothetical protein
MQKKKEFNKNINVNLPSSIPFVVIGLSLEKK